VTPSQAETEECVEYILPVDSWSENSKRPTVHPYVIEELSNRNILYCLRFHVLTAASMKMTVFWDAARSSLVSEVLTASIIRTLMMEAVSTSEASVSFYETARRNIPEYSHLNILYCLCVTIKATRTLHLLRWYRLIKTVRHHKISTAANLWRTRITREYLPPRVFFTKENK
jgi:hypothetical protein